METTDLNELITLYYQVQRYDENIGDNVIVLDPIFTYDIFAKVSQTSFTAYFKFKELGNENMKRFHTVRIEFDPKKTVVIEYKGNKYKVLKFEDIDDDFMLYDAELIVSDEI